MPRPSLHDMRPLAWLLLAVLAKGQDNRQLESIRRQQDSVSRQIESVQRQSVASQFDSLARQVKSARPQSALVPQWKLAPPLVTVMAEPVAYLECPPLAKSKADQLIHAAALHEDLPPELLRAVIKQESGFRPCAISNMGAQGLMQLMPGTAADLNVQDPFNPEQNVFGGAAYLKQLVNRYGGDLKLALGAYNAGFARVDASGGVPDIAETQDYVSRIDDDYEHALAEKIPGIAEPETAVNARPASIPLPLSNVRLTSLEFAPEKLNPKQ